MNRLFSLLLKASASSAIVWAVGGASTSVQSAIFPSESGTSTSTPRPNGPFAKIFKDVRGGEIEFGIEWEVETEIGDEFPLANSPNESELSSCCSNWAKFAPGSWARLRTTSVAYENGKAIQSVTETRILLTKIDSVAKNYELQYDATIKMGNVDYPRKSETVLFDFWDVPVDVGATVETLAPVNLMIARKAIPCQTRRLTRTTSQFQETTTLWFSPVVAPYVLQKEVKRANLPGAPSLNSASSALGTGTATSGASGATLLSRELSVVQKTSAHLLLGGNLATYAASTSAQKGRRFDSTSTTYSTSTPGGIVRETTIEKDEKGAVLYRSSTVLLDYYIAPQGCDVY